jgi:hypothetical protein
MPSPLARNDVTRQYSNFECRRFHDKHHHTSRMGSQDTVIPTKRRDIGFARSASYITLNNTEMDTAFERHLSRDMIVDYHYDGPQNMRLS